MMKRFLRVYLLPLASALSAAIVLPGCGTQEVRPDQAVLRPMPADPSQGGLLISVAPSAATSDEAQADGRANREPVYHVLVDGKELAYDDTFSVQPIAVGGGGQYSGGFHDAGMHHFTFVAQGRPEIFAADGAIASGALTRLYLFGPSEARVIRIVSYPFVGPVGAQHVSAINMVRSGGVEIEIVSCTDAKVCTPVSPPIGYGETFEADLAGGATSGDGAFSLTTAGAGYGYRQTAPALPAPPVLSLLPGIALISPDPGVPAAAFVAAPIYMAPDGTWLQASN